MNSSERRLADLDNSQAAEELITVRRQMMQLYNRNESLVEERHGHLKMIVELREQYLTKHPQCMTSESFTENSALILTPYNSDNSNREAETSSRSKQTPMKRSVHERLGEQVQVEEHQHEAASQPQQASQEDNSVFEHNDKEEEANKITPVNKKKNIQRITFVYGHGHATKLRTVPKYNPKLPPPNFPRIQDVFSLSSSSSSPSVVESSSSSTSSVEIVSPRSPVMTRAFASAQSTPNPRRTILGPYKETKENKASKPGRIPKISSTNEVKYTKNDLLSRGMNIEDFVEQGGFYTKRLKDIRVRMGCGRQGQKQDASDLTVIMPKRQKLDLSVDPDALDLSTDFGNLDRDVGFTDTDTDEYTHSSYKVIKKSYQFTNNRDIYHQYPYEKFKEKHLNFDSVLENSLIGHYDQAKNSDFPQKPTSVFSPKPIYFCTDLNDSINYFNVFVYKLFSILGKENLDLSSYVNVVRNLDLFLQFNQLLFMKEGPNGRWKTSSPGMNESQSNSIHCRFIFTLVIFILLFLSASAF